MIISKTISQSLVSGFRKVKALVFGGNDIREANEVMSFGIDSGVPAGFQAIYAYTSNRSKPVIIGYIWSGAVAAPGETRLYSTNGAKESTTPAVELWLRTDGTIEVGGNAHHLTQYEALATAFNQLKSDFNNLVSAYNSHTHTGPFSGPTAPTTSTGSSSSADITPAKLTNIKTQ